MERFPEDFIFELAENEVKTEVSQNVIPPKKHLGGASPFTLPEKKLNPQFTLSGMVINKLCSLGVRFVVRKSAI